MKCRLAAEQVEQVPLYPQALKFGNNAVVPKKLFQSVAVLTKNLESDLFFCNRNAADQGADGARESLNAWPRTEGRGTALLASLNCLVGGGRSWEELQEAGPARRHTFQGMADDTVVS